MYNESAWKEIKRLEESIDNQRLEELALAEDGVLAKGTPSVLKDRANRIPVMVDDPDNPGTEIPVISYLQRVYTNAGREQDFYNLFYKEKFVYNEKTGKRTLKKIPLDTFYMLWPKDARDVQVKPSGRYSKITGGSLVNMQYNPQVRESY